MTPDELYQLLGHKDVFRDLDVKTLVLDIVKRQFSQEELLEIFWRYLDPLDEEYMRGYLYRRF